MNSVMGWLSAWFLMFLLLFVLAKTRAGHTVIYYGAWMLVLFLVVTHSKQLTTILEGGHFNG